MRESLTRRRFLGSVGLAGATLAGASSPVAASTSTPPTPTDDVEFHEGLTYAERPGGTLELDLWVPDTDGPAPLVVFIHGGGWIVGTRKDHPDLERYFASRGIAMASIEYRLAPLDGHTPVIPVPPNPAPRAVFPAQILDVKAAIRWLRANADEYGLDPSNVATWGSSAGSHLAALAGTVGDVETVAGDVYPASAVTPTVHPDESGRVQAVVGWYTPTDFLEMDPQLGDTGWFSHDAPNSPESLLVGGQITENPEKVQRADPITYVDGDDPPFLLMHGEQDITVPYEQSEILFEALAEACVDSTLYVLHGLGHGFGVDALTAKPVIDQTVYEARCRGSGRGSAPAVSTRNGPPAGPTVMEQFLDRHLRG